MPTVARILELAPVSCYLASNFKNKSAIFNGIPKSANNQATLIYIYWKILNKIYVLDPTYPGLTAPANYLYELEQKFAYKAANIVDGGGGGSVTPITPLVTRPDPYFFIVSASSFIANGASSKLIPEFVGFNLAFSRGQGWESTINTEPSYYTWDRDSGLFTCSPAAITSELFILMPT